jgi:outer membrane protein
MKTKIILLAFILLAGFGFRAQAQDKVAYADIQLILAYMPETKTMSQTLETYGKKLEEAIKPKMEYFQQKRIELEEWAKANQNATEQDLGNKIKELNLENLQKEVQTASADAEQKLAKKQADLMGPITDKLQAAVKDVAAAGSYTVVINKTDGSGVSIVLHGPEERDITKQVMQKLGIQLPDNK